MKIVVGFLDSPEGRAALEAAVAEAGAHDAELVVVHTWDRDRTERQLAAVEMELDRLRATLDESRLGYRILTPRAASDPADAIVGVATAEAADLVVVGLTRRTPTGKAFFGSTGQTVLLDAPCPVLAVKAR